MNETTFSCGGKEVNMTAKNFMSYAHLAYDKAYDDMNINENGHYVPTEQRIMPLYKMLKYNNKLFGETYINAFIHPEDKEADFIDDLKYEHYEF